MQHPTLYNLESAWCLVQKVDGFYRELLFLFGGLRLLFRSRYIGMKYHIHHRQNMYCFRLFNQFIFNCTNTQEQQCNTTSLFQRKKTTTPIFNLLSTTNINAISVFILLCGSPSLVRNFWLKMCSNI